MQKKTKTSISLNCMSFGLHLGFVVDIFVVPLCNFGAIKNLVARRK